MIYTTLDTLIEKIQSIAGEDVMVNRYKGEFEEGGEWNPVFPAVFVNIPRAEPIIETDSTIVAFSITANIYIAVKNDIPEYRIYFDGFLNALDGLGLNLPSGIEKLSVENIQLHGYFYGVDVYRVEIALIKKL